MLYSNIIELLGDLRELLIQIQSPNADLVSAHLIAVIRLQLFICFCIKKHARY